jgi:Phytanoyl-CoA dioxygenase (PhyH)
VRLKPDQLAFLDEHGYLLIEGLLSESELEAVHEELPYYFPTGAERHARPERYRGLTTDVPFPVTGPAINQVFVHPNVLSVVGQLLGTDDVRLTDAVLRAKYPTSTEGGLRLHVDFWGKNSLTYPRDEGVFRQILILVYFSDVTEGTGPTFVVPREHYRDDPLYPWKRTREEHPEMYALERPVLAPAGSGLIVSMRTFHRGSKVTDPKGARFNAFVGYRAAECGWMETHHWGTGGETRMRDFLESATPQQREVLGFPPPGHAYWNADTILGVSRRYPGMDMSPYTAALGS